MLPTTKNSSYNLSSPFILYLCHTLKIYKPKYYKTMAKELELKYGCNPNQKPSRIFMQKGELPIEVLNGRPGYINFLDAFNSWQLVKELKEATGLPAAASFKHVSPAGAAVGIELNDTLKKIYFVNDLPLTPLATAYARARGADQKDQRNQPVPYRILHAEPDRWYHPGLYLAADDQCGIVEI